MIIVILKYLSQKQPQLERSISECILEDEIRSFVISSWYVIWKVLVHDGSDDEYDPFFCHVDVDGWTET